MRINVYAEEITGETQLVTKHVDDGCSTCDGKGWVVEGGNGPDPEQVQCPREDCNHGRVNPRTFHGVRFFIDSPASLHHSPEDDDRSAVTLWVPWTKAKGHDFKAVHAMLMALDDCLLSAADTDKPGQGAEVVTSHMEHPTT